eukprot:TRINITY_DN438_c0_g1_i3.p1 TRINITY_DN438_c0_g1~~TRINITY_DN438_c0_g1_i3.p1  ORF type:complete len:382 (+),score=72.71 TRINITY_DN438_c0_g1_i3:29-1174(+)
MLLSFRYVTTTIIFLLGVSLIPAELASLERNALKTLYLDLRGDYWDFEGCNHWDITNDTSDPCSGKWCGVACTDDGAHLLEVSLSSKNLFGVIPPSIGDLGQYLQVLDLSHNSIRGDIPYPFTDITNLMFLDISGNQISGNFHHLVTRTGAFSKLKYLDIEGNRLTGPINFLSLLPSLESANLNGNEFTGGIPKGISKISRTLFSLKLNSNHLSGSIPEEIGQMDMLRDLDLGNNYIRGYIPSLPSSLETIILTNNDFFCPIALELDNVGCISCQPGYQMISQQKCAICSAGNYSNDGISCQECPANTYSHPGATDCTPCPNNMVSFPGSSLCYVESVEVNNELIFIFIQLGLSSLIAVILVITCAKLFHKQDDGRGYFLQ